MNNMAHRHGKRRKQPIGKYTSVRIEKHFLWNAIEIEIIRRHYISVDVVEMDSAEADAQHTRTHRVCNEQLWWTIKKDESSIRTRNAKRFNENL